jgi:carboxymethylenebutenolidase
MSHLQVSIPTRDGHCPASLFTPQEGSGPWPGVIFYMDAPGIRPTMAQMAQRLADHGYVVLLPDLYYRLGPYAQMVPAKVFADPEAKENMMKMLRSLDRDSTIADAQAFLAFLSSRPEVIKHRLGATGYCMGGRLALTAAGACPDRFSAVAAFHAAGVVTEQADSPHRFVEGITGHVYVAGADQDAGFTVQQKDQLEAALREAGVTHQVEIYAGALHGYAVPDHPAFNAQAAERHWQALAALFAQTLGAA